MSGRDVTIRALLGAAIFSVLFGGFVLIGLLLNP